MTAGSGCDHLLLLLLDQHSLPDPRHRRGAGPGLPGDLPDTGTAGQSLLDLPGPEPGASVAGPAIQGSVEVRDTARLT